MSLFKTREFWSTFSEDDEYFDQNSMITTKLTSDSDYIITGSQSGVLRIFKPSCTLTENNNLSGYNVADLLLEKIFDNPLLQVGCGRLVSGSQNVQIAVLHPRMFSIYFLTSKEGATEHGTQHILQLMYEHKLKRLAYNFVIGPFGGTQNRDFVCIQSIDGILSFFEQETSTFSCSIPDFLLPGPLAYIKKTDSFVTISSNWHIESYRYKFLSENGQSNGEKNQIRCDWSHNIGEAILDIAVIDDFINKESWVMVLGERNLFSLNDSGKIKFMRKLDFSPICFNTYIIDDKVMSMVVSETNTLLIYQNTSLKWSAHLQFLPVSIKRAFLQTIKGAIVLLSEEGRLECCYLGTEPSLFVAPPLSMKEIDFEKAGDELTTSNKIIKNSYGNDTKVNNSAAERELSINLCVNPHLELCTYENNLVNALNNQMCLVTIELLPQALFEEIQISVLVQKPLKVMPPVHFFNNLSERTSLKCDVFLYEPFEVSSLRLQVIASFTSNMGVPRTLNKTAMLPLKLVTETIQPQRESEHKITLNINCSPVPLATLFPEYVGENSLSQSSSAIGFKNVVADDSKIVTILLAKSSERYRLQSNSFASLNLLIEQLIHRLKRHFSNKNDFSISYNSPLPANELLFYVHEHFQTRQKVSVLQNELTKLSTQFRIIQKRLIGKFKAKSPSNLSHMEILLDDTYADITKISDELQDEMGNLDRAQVDLSCAVNITSNLITLMDITSKEFMAILTSTFCQDICDLDSQNWEDVLDGSLNYLIRTILAKSDKDKLRATQTSFDEVKDISKLEKHLIQVLERIPKKGSIKNTDWGETSDETKNDDKAEKNPIPLGSQFGELSSRLLSARKSLLTKRQKMED